MTRYSRERAEITRLEILESATELFRHHRVNEVSLAKIMSKIGMTPSAVYQHFDSKEELASEVCSRTFRDTHDTWTAVIDRARQQSQSPLHMLIGEYLLLAKQGHCPIIALGPDAEGAPHDHPFARAYRDGSKGLLDVLTQVSEERKNHSSRENTLVLFAAMLGVGLLSRVAGGEQWAEEIEKAFLDSC